MLIVLHPTYSLRVEIKDRPVPQGGNFGIGSDQVITRPHKWFDTSTGKVGCDEVLAAVKDALSKAGLDADVSFDKFERRA